MNGFSVIFCTSPIEESDEIAKALTEERLAACVNVTDVMSYFIWEDEFGQFDYTPL